MRTPSFGLRAVPTAYVFAFVALTGLAFSATARADDAVGETPILVVVESANAYGNVAKIRAGIARELGVPAISLIEAQGRTTQGTLQVAIAHGGSRASIHYVPSDGLSFAVLINVSAEGRADRAGEWLVAPCASAVRTSEQRRASRAVSSELLDPWLRARTQRPGVGGASEVLDPFVGDPPRRVRVTVSDYFLGPEVLDPWADAVAEYQRERAHELAVPPRTGAPSRTRSPSSAASPR